MNSKYDAIVIGSGIGGLATATILTKVGKKKVLVIEQHWELGGLTHEFKRKVKFSWDVGVHYIGKMKEGEMGGNIFNFITNKKLKWNALPYEFEKFIYPDFTFTVPSNEKEYTEKLCKQFPEEKVAIKTYFKDMKKAGRWAQLKMMAELVPSFIGFFIRLWNQRSEKLALSTTQEYLDAHFKNPKLKALLVSQWGDYGLPPAKSAFLIHSIIATHYLEGAVYPEGGASTIAEAAKTIIESNGGKCLLSTEVTRLIVEDNTVIGVEVQHKRGEKQVEIFEAPIVVSSTGALHSYSKLLKGFVPESYYADLKAIPKGKSAVTLYLGLKKDPSELGFKGENNWIYESYNHDEEAANSDNTLLKGNPKACYLSFPSLKNKSAKGHTAEIISFANFDSFVKWENTKWRKRGEDYEALKKIISEGLLNLVEKHYSGFKDLVEYMELSTPLTYVELSGRPNGEFYGLSATPERYKLKWLGAKTPLKNFYLSGSDVMSLGIMGALMGGVATAASILEPAGFPKIMKAVNAESKH
ncbi:MAG: NAD(P)/FAD-dependent oxidoreductase [Leptospiraceae bacterium]|nr:NAD(P)/FAD-dependent oxidoreductase [Leptospiraceae bacterium]